MFHSVFYRHMRVAIPKDMGLAEKRGKGLLELPLKKNLSPRGWPGDTPG